MPQPVKRLQPKSYPAFRCIGAECEDTCCIGWNVNVDKQTFEAYQRVDDPELGPRLRERVTVNPNAKRDDGYARIALSGDVCPFFSEGLCEIQKKLGEEYLSNMCARYPRAMNIVDDVLERSLDLSCPEAARVVLLDPAPIEFEQIENAADNVRTGSLPVLRTSADNSGKPYAHFHEIRSLVIWLLQRRVKPLWKRVAILGSVCDQLHQTVTAGRPEQIPAILEACRDRVIRNLFEPALDTPNVQAAKQIEMVVELVVARITSDYTSPRFRGCYQEFMQGLEWTMQSSMADLAQRFESASANYYAPFMRKHEQILEHYLVSYIFRTLFPLGPQEVSSELGASHVGRSIRDECLLMLVHYAVVQTLLIGIGALHKSQFDAHVVIRVIQTSVRTFEHSVDFPGRALEILASKGVDTCSQLALLLRN